jgi:aerobic-type carbon monoxide dehydrogenase small subunit (CoxS/CutS family)
MSDSSRQSSAGAAPAAGSWHPLQRVAEQVRGTVHFILNGAPATALAGDTLMTAVLTQCGHLRTNEFSHRHRAGFCMMGACQDCIVELGSGQRVRACSTLVSEGIAVWTLPRPQEGARHE